MAKRERSMSPRSPLSNHPQQEKSNTSEEGVVDPGENDVISGRGDTINRHPGNVQFRKLVDEKRRVYLSSHFKREKRLIAETIVAAIKEMDPPGRFLSKDPKTGLWVPIDDDRAREKASQALRENSKKIKAVIQQDDLVRMRERTQPPPGHPIAHNGRMVHDYPPPAGKPGQYDPPCHYPYPPPGPGWAYPYYYGYGVHQMPPYPPVFHPHGYPHPHQQHPGGSVYGYPEGVPYSSSHEMDEAPKSPSIRTASDEHGEESDHDDDNMDCSSRTHRQDHTQEQEERSNVKCRRLDPPQDVPKGGLSTNRTTDKLPEPSSCYSPRKSPTGIGFGQSANNPGILSPNGSTLDTPPPDRLKLPSQLPAFHPVKSPTSSSAVPPRYSVMSRSNPSSRSETPTKSSHRLALEPSPYLTIKSPHNNNFGHPLAPFNSSSLSNHTHRNPDFAALTPAGANCIAALDDLLGSRTNASMGFSPDPPSPKSSRDPAVPFSPIRSHVQHGLENHVKGACPRTSLQPRPCYRQTVDSECN